MNLVTGATGILGSHVLLRLLLNGQPVIALKRSDSDIEKVKDLFAFYTPDHKQLFAKINWVELDVLDVYGMEQVVKDAAVVYHCAGYVSFDPADRKKLFRINEQGTANVVNACLHHNVDALCHASTIGTISNSDVQELTEAVFWKRSGNESDYALSKYNAEREVWRGIEEGLNAVIVNPGVIVAPVFWDQSSGKIFRNCAKGNRFYTSGSSAYITAMDAAKAMILLVNGRHFANRYILAENNYDLRTIFSRIQINLGKSAPHIKVGKKALYLASGLERFSSIFTKKPPVLTKSLINSAFNRQIYSNSKVTNTLNTSFTPVLEALDEICAYYQTVSTGS